jgi:hypothetical protein
MPQPATIGADSGLMVPEHIQFGHGCQFQARGVGVAANDLETGVFSVELGTHNEGKEGGFIFGKEVFGSFFEGP